VVFDCTREPPAGITRNKGAGAELGSEGREQLLRGPTGPEQPITKPAIGNLDIGAWRHGTRPPSGKRNENFRRRSAPKDKRLVVEADQRAHSRKAAGSRQ